MNGNTLRINRERLIASLAAMSGIGGTPAGGVTRLALSAEDKQARDLLTHWLGETGLDTRVDDVGNMSAVLQGASPELPVLMGSHLDTVIKGGRFDGVLGVMCALEVLRTLRDNGVTSRHPVGLVNWTNEEGVRFQPAVQCSAVVAGRIDPDFVLDLLDKDGLRFGDELTHIGYAGSPANRPLPASAYFELHIEQGPVLETEQFPVGVVEGIVGITWQTVTIDGVSDHAGPSPMRSRHDAMMAAAEIIQAIETFVLATDEVAVGTVGKLIVSPNTTNTIPGRVEFSVDFRHPSDQVLDQLATSLAEIVESVSRKRGVTGTVDRYWTSEATPFDPEMVATVRESAKTLAVPTTDLWSGAGHDCKYMADVIPSTMIFVRSQGGLSHCEAEYSTADDIEAGANVLLRSVLAAAQ